MKRMQVVDLDGCIADDRWRRPLIKPTGPDRFDDYHLGCGRDVFRNGPEVIDGAEVIILTGRPLMVRAQTLRWLEEVAGITPSVIIMRNNNDHTPSPVLKRHMAKALFCANSYNLQPEWIVSAIDDRADIVTMYREEFNFNARVVRIGEEENVYG